MNLAARLVRACAALALVVGISAGVPWALLTYIGNPLPRRTPGLHEISTWMTVRVDIHTFIDAAVFVLWTSWAVFVVQVAVQIPGAIADLARVLRHREPAARRTVGPGGAFAHGLVAAFTIALVAPRGVSAHATAKASTGFVVSASARVAAVAPAVPGAARPAADVYTVVAGDTLWDIAADRLGHAERWLEIYRLNQGRLQAGGDALTDPALIMPGWQLTLPDEHRYGVDASADDPHGELVPTRPEQTSATVLNTLPIHIPAPTTTPIAPTPERPAAATPNSAAHTRVSPRDRMSVQLPGGGLVPITLASGVAAALALARLRTRAKTRFHSADSTDALSLSAPRFPVGELLQRAHAATMCAPGRGLFQDDDDFGKDPQTEVATESVEPSELSTGDSCGWSLASLPADTGPTPILAPGVRAVLEAVEAPTDVFIAERDHQLVGLLTLTDAGLGLCGDGAADVARSLLLSALAAGGPRAIDQGVEVHTTTDVIDALVSSPLDITSCERLTVFESTASLLAATQSDLSSRTAELAEYGYTTAAEVRRYANLEPFRPRILLLRPDAAERHRLDEVSRSGVNADVHLVILGPWATGTCATINADHTFTVDGPARDQLSGASLYRVDAGQAAAVFDALLAPNSGSPADLPFTDTSDDDGEPLTPTPGDTPDKPSLTPPHLVAVPTATRAVPGPGMLAINLMGPFTAEIDGRDVTAHFSPSHRTLLIYLALHERPLLRTTITEALWIDDHRDDEKAKAKRKVRFDTRLYQTKKALAAAAGQDAEFILTERGSGLISLNRSLVLTDLACFDDLVRTATLSAEDTDKVAHLEAACALYRGPIDESIRADWLLEHREDRLRRYRDTAGDLARIIGRTNPDRGLAILNQLLEHDLFNEDLYRRIMRGQARLGRLDAVRRTFNLLETRFEALELDIDPSTRALVHALTRKGAA